MKDTNPYLSLIKDMKRVLLLDVMVGLPGKVLSYNPDTQRAVVECGIQKHTGGGEFRTIPGIEHVPVQFAGTAQWIVFHELPEGTEGYIHFSHRAVDYWIDQGGPVRPLDARMFDSSDAFFAPGYRSRATCIAGLPTSGIGMSNRDGSAMLHLSDDGIEMIAGGQQLTLNDSGLQHNGKNVGDTHVHAGVQPGGSKTSPPE
ncbi:Gp138 family membrane-puncturing spike protein [Klebsiella oxytoca]